MNRPIDQVATGALPRAKYCDGCFVSIAAELDGGGQWLAGWITASAAVSCVGLFIAEMVRASVRPSVRVCGAIYTKI